MDKILERLEQLEKVVKTLNKELNDTKRSVDFLGTKVNNHPPPVVHHVYDKFSNFEGHYPRNQFK